MSRFIKNPVPIPAGVEVVMDNYNITSSGPAGVVRRRLDSALLSIERGDDGLRVRIVGDNTAESRAMAGTYWSVLAGMVTGAQKGFEIILDLVGVGYRAQVAGAEIQLQLGFSHPLVYRLPDGVTAKSPSPTEIILSGADKILVGQTAAKIRAYRPPEPYKGKGVRYRGEKVVIKETKKK